MRKRTSVMLTVILVLILSLTMTFGITAYADGEPVGAGEAPTEDVVNKDAGAEPESGSPLTEETPLEIETEEQQPQAPASEAPSEDTPSDAQEPGQEPEQDEEQPEGETPTQPISDEEPSQEPTGEEVEEPVEANQQDSENYDSGTGYNIHITGDNGSTVDVTGGTEIVIETVLTDLGYELGEDAVIEVKLDEVNTDYVNVTENENGQHVLTDNGPFGNAGNLIVYVNGVAITLELVDPTTLWGNKTAQAVQDAFGDADNPLNVQLTDDVTLTNDVSITLTAGVHDLYLNGKMLSAMSGATQTMFVIGTGVTLNIYGGADADTAGGGVITSARSLFEVSGGGVLNIFSGSLTSTGQAALDVNQGGEVNISGGSITSNNSYALDVSQGTANISGGTFTGKARCINVTDAATVNINGGSFTATKDTNGDALYVSKGIVNISGGTFTGTGKSIIVTSNLDAKVNVVGGTFNGGISKGTNATLAIAGGTFSVDPGAYLLGGSANWTVDNTTDPTKWIVTANTYNSVHIDSTGTMTGKSTASDFQNAFGTSGMIVMLKDITANVSIASGNIIVLNLNGHVLSGDGTASVIINRGVLTLIDSNTGSETHHFSDSDTTTGLWVWDSTETAAAHTVSGGVITGGKAVGRGGGVCNYGTFTMNGGSIVGNTIGTSTGGQYKGGGVYNYGTFIMAGGSISGNTAYDGGGIDNNGNVVITGGKVSDNTATCGGGIANASKCTITGGEITGNRASSGGGVRNVWPTDITLIIGGTAKIKGNTSDGTNASNVYIANGCIITVDTPASGMEIWVTNESGTGVITTWSSADYKQYFHSDSDDYAVGNEKNNQNNRVYIGIPVAELDGTTKYLTVQEAIDAVGAGAADAKVSGTVKMLADSKENVTIGQYQIITLDLNGKVLKADLSDGIWHSVIVNYGNLTLTDGAPTAEHYFTYVPDGAWTLYDGIPAENVIDLAAFDLDAVKDASKTYYIKVTGGVVTGGEAAYGGGVITLGDLSMDGGSIIGNIGEYAGGGVFSPSYDFTFTMTGGHISGNTAEYGGGVYNSGTFNMHEGGKITGNTAEYGGGVYNSDTFNMHGGGICGNSAYDGGGVYNGENSTFTKTFGDIDLNIATHGGGVCNYGMFIMDYGDISGNDAEYGGGVFIGDGTFEMNDGHITDSRVTDGGGVFMNGGTFTMNDGLIDSNFVNGNGGGVYMYGGTFNLTGGNITKNTAANGGGVYMYGGTFNMYDGNIFGNSATDNGGGVYNASNMTIGGTAQIKDNTLSDGTTKNNLYLTSGKTVTVATDPNAPAQGMEIWVTTEDTPAAGSPIAVTGKNDADYSEYFHSDKAAYVVDDIKGTVYLGVPVAELNNSGGTAKYLTVQKAVDKAETAMSTVKMLGSSTENVTIEQYQIITLDLNGHVLKADLSDGIWHSVIVNYGNLTLIDSDTTAEHYFTYVKDDAWTLIENPTEEQKAAAKTVDAIDSTTTVVKVLGGVVTGGTGISTVDSFKFSYGGGVFNYGTFTMSGGSIVGNSAAIGGGVHNYGIFSMSGGSIAGNVATIGGGITDLDLFSLYGVSSIFTMSGGSIVGNSAAIGGGVLMFGTFRMNGGSISGNLATNVGGVCSYGNMTVGGTAQIKDNTLSDGTTANNLYLTSGNTVIVDTPASGMEIWVTTQTTPAVGSPVAVTGKNNADYSEYFHSDKAAYVVDDIKGTVYLGVPVAELNGTTRYLTVQKAVDKAGTDTSTVKMLESSTENVTIGKKQVITLDLNGKVLTGDGTNSVITNNGELTLTDSAPTAEHYFTYVKDGAWTLYNGTPTENVIDLADFTLDAVADDTKTYYIKVSGGVVTGGTGTKIYPSTSGGGVCNYGTFTMDGGNIVGNSVDELGGGVYSYEKAKFTMNGGSISGNSADELGGGVYNDSKGTFKMTGGNIVGNTAKLGGGVRNYGTFAMDGGSITGNTAELVGGGAYLDGISTMSSGKISGNTAERGGGIYTGLSDEESFTMNGGEISGNVADLGGGVCSGGRGAFTMNGGSITGNRANDGGGVENYGTFTMNGGEISGNTAVGNGGGVDNYINDTFTMTGGVITGNRANDGGGVYNWGGAFTMNGGSISGNSAAGNGGGVYNTWKFTMDGGSISGNSAAGNGGGVYLDNKYTAYATIIVGGTAKIKDNTLSDGTTANNLYLPSGKTVTVATGTYAPTQGMEIWVTTEDTPAVGAPVPVTGVNVTDYSKYFHSDNDRYTVYNDKNVVYLVAPAEDDRDWYGSKPVVDTTDEGCTADFTVTGGTAKIFVADENGKVTEPKNVRILLPEELLSMGAETAEFRMSDTLSVVIDIKAAMCGKSSCVISVDRLGDTVTVSCDGSVIFTADLSDIIEQVARLVYDGTSLKAFDKDGKLVKEYEI